MTNERRSADGFDGRYPKPLDWDAIEAELIAKAAGERGKDVASEDDRPADAEQ